MKSYSQYAWSVLFGLYFYILFQVVFLVRFGQFNIGFSYLDLGLWLVGVFSIMIATYFCQKLAKGKWYLLIPFVIALPFSFFGALGGGLLGLLPLVIFGIIPFAILIPPSYWLIKWLTAKTEASDTPVS